MKLYQRLLVAPAALGLMAPMAANAADLNINGVSDYSASSIEAQNFSDVLPTDWTFKALTDLAERSGCAVATPSNSMTRYEAAALLNKCLGNVAEVTEDEKLLINEFSPELAVIKGRVDGLEARIGEFEAGQFSATTRMTGKAAFIVGYVDDGGTDADDEITMSYKYQLDMNSSFTNRGDSLYTRLKAGNGGANSNHWSSTQGKSYGTYLSAAHNNSDNVLDVDKIWYSFPVGDSVTAYVGPLIENYYMMATSPSIYKPVTKQFALAGHGAYGSSTSAGFGANWKQQTDDPSAASWKVSAAYTNQEGDNPAKDNGLFGDGKSSLLTKVEYGSPRWQAAVAVAAKDNGWSDSYFTTGKGKTRASDSSETQISLTGYWKPEETGAIPSVQIGYHTSTIDDVPSGSATETSGYMIGFGWDDLFIDGNKAGFAFGSRIAGTELNGNGDDAAVDNSVWEAYYSFKVNDGVTITPALFGGDEVYNGTEEIKGGVVLTEFRF